MDTGFLLLSVLDDAVRSGAPRHLSGDVCVGVCGPRDVLFWTACAGSKPVTRWSEAPPEDAAAVLLLAESDARSILEHGALPAEPALTQLYGDRRLVEALLDGYLTTTTLLGLRAGRSGS